MGVIYRFVGYALDPAERRLSADGLTIDLPGRYLDALALLVAGAGQLVTKDRFMSEVWRGVPVTDEALTQCVRVLRQRLGDDAARPRFIETVPKHGYRFVAPVDSARAARIARDWRRIGVLATAGTLGGAVAGAIGGLGYGLLATAPGSVGATAVLLVMLAITVAIGAAGGAGVALGAALARGRWAVVGGAIGGMVVGGVSKLLGNDAFRLLLGQGPGDITGAAEGLALGGATAFALQFARRGHDGRGTAIARTAALGAATGVLIVALGGHLLAGSLFALVRTIPGAHLRLDPIWLDASMLGPAARWIAGGAEGGLFATGVVAAMLIAERALAVPHTRTATPPPASSRSGTPTAS